MKRHYARLIVKICGGWLALSLAMIAQADGPSAVAKTDTLRWPEPINSKEAFDTASRAEILLFLSVYKEKFAHGIEAKTLGVKTINQTSLERWQSRFKNYWLNTYFDAAQHCRNDSDMGCDFKAADFDSLLTYANKFKNGLPANFQAWSKMSQNFYAVYLKEQVRLAALFPHPTSEILPLAETEIFGDHFKDGEFLLTFDDGPTQTDDTAKYAQLLRANGIAVFFFTLGDALETKLHKTDPTALKQIYQGHCLASHGYHHQSHQKWDAWEFSINKTHDMIQQITKTRTPVAFRPPYGQLNNNLIHSLANQHAAIILWNIDSQDWQNSITAGEVSVRVRKLMLLWRKGIILFHDVHKKAFTAIPDVIKLGEAANLHWVDCRTLS